MAWAEPAFSRGDVDKAGRILVSEELVMDNEWEDALLVINNWRASHSRPLLAFRVTLTGRAKRVDQRAIIAQRLKRLSSIAIKLQRNEKMALSQMQDIGGCRAVVHTVRHVDKLVAAYEASAAKNPSVRAEFVKKYDYITTPKKDGYRSVHMIYKYRTRSRKHQSWVGLRIEIQLRSRLQHAWATAVETVDTFTRQTIKTGGGMDVWRRFFLLMGSAIATMERRPLCPGCSDDLKELRRELQELVEELKVRTVLRGWANAVRHLPSIGTSNAEVFLLNLNVTDGSITVLGFPNSDIAKASDQYLALEKQIKDSPNAQAVLVSVESMQSLRSAFPNYFADTSVFINAVNQAVLGRFRTDRF